MEEKKGPKYGKIREAGKELFWKHGISRVNVDEICLLAGVSRMTFYKYFRNKTDLALNILESFYDENLRRYNSIMRSDKDFADKAKELILLKIDGTNDLSKEFVDDIFRMKDSEVSKWYQKIYANYMDIMEKDLIMAQKKGEIRKDLKIEFIMYFFDKTYIMVTDPVLLSHYESVQEMILEVINFFFYGIMPPKGKVK